MTIHNGYFYRRHAEGATAQEDHAPKPCAAQEEAEKIASMEYFDDLKKFACPKALANRKSWYMVCVSCQGLDNCKPGKRAVELLEMQAKPEEKNDPVVKFNERVDKWNTIKARDNYIQALRQEDPIRYLMKSKQVTIKVARECMRKWRVKFPEIVIPEKGTTYHQRMAIEGRNKCIAAFECGMDPMEYLMKTEELDRKTARTRMDFWARQYKDLEQKYHISDYLKETKIIAGLSKETIAKNAIVMQEKARQACAELFESGEDPIEKYMREHNSNRKVTRARILDWANHFPDLDEKYGLRKYLDDKKLRHDKNENIMTAGRSKSGAIQREKARQMCIGIFESGEDPLEKYIRDSGANRISVRNRFHKWAENFPDLDEKYGIQEYLKNHRSPKGRKTEEKKEDIPMAVVKMNSQEDVNDEVSVDDFLKEMEAEEKTKPVLKAEIKNGEPLVKVVKPSPAPVVAPAVNPGPSDLQKNICTAFSEKRKELMKGIDELKSHIESLRDMIIQSEQAIKTQEEKLKALDMTAEMMGLRRKEG